LIDYNVELSDPAKNDLREMHEYILTNFFSQQSADAKVDLILKALEVLINFPEGFPTVASRGHGQLVEDKNYRYMPIENYIAFFYIEHRKVYVARVLSFRQNWVKIFIK
jgi:plasmid stabilization system protein ParE